MELIKKKIKNVLLKTLWKYDGAQLVRFLKKRGIEKGDTLVVHASWLKQNGFQGSPLDFINAIKEVVTDQGLLVMMSMPYQNQSSAEFIRRGGQMKVNRSPSKMGLLSEVFRRGKETHRSLSPTHPVLAWGKDAQAFLAGHIECLEPFGKGSPFEKMLLRNAKIMAVDTPFSTVTFTHFLEDSVSDQLSFRLYEEESLIGTVVTDTGEELNPPVKVLSQEANARRREDRLIAFLQQEKAINNARLGATRFIFMECAKLRAATEKMYQQKISMFD